MHIILCDINIIEQAAEFYDDVTAHLEKNINYPKWRHKQYPNIDSVKTATENGSQYVCIDENKIVGAFVINNDPQGDYDVGQWSKQLKRGEYLVIHSLAVAPNKYKEGIASFMMNFIINYANKQNLHAIRLDIVPQNTPAKMLYEKFRFKFVGEYDLKRNFDDIPTFCLYELNL